MSKIEVNNLEDAESYQFDEITECWTNLVSADDYGVFLGVCAYGALPKGTSPEDLAHPEGEAELFHVIRGNGFVFLEGNEVTPLRAGDSFVLPAQPNHQIWSASEDEPIVILFVAMDGKRRG
ncbi:cupin domain-containing protein [Microbacterium sp.]|uniref:cupin domain-containing protein n=1 Tax=Microbacterium sp. TaxID=51671 RepID=UPI0028118676|nr:cupin domain-containing protein [Microbacterium sp.]